MRMMQPRMDQAPGEQTSPRTILVSRLDGLGDAVLGTTLLSGLHARWPESGILLLVRPKLIGLHQILPAWVQVISLGFDSYAPVQGKEEQIADLLCEVSRDLHPDLMILSEYNRAWAAELLAMLSGVPRVIAFENCTGLNVANRPIRERLGLPKPQGWELVKTSYEWPEVKKYHAMLLALGIDPAPHLPIVHMQVEDRNAAAAFWSDSGFPPGKTPLVLFPSSGDGLLRSLPARAWARWAAHLAQRRDVVFLGSETDAPALEAIAAAGLSPEIKRLILPGNRPGLLAGVLEMASGYIGADTGPMHMAAALNRPTLGVFGGGTIGRFSAGSDPRRFLPVGERAAAIRMPLGCFGCGWECAFDQRLCLTHMPIDQVIASGDVFVSEYLDGGENPDPLSPRIFDLQPPAELPLTLLGPIMRQHQQFLKLNHEITEHHDYLERILADMTRHNIARDNAIQHINNVLAEMTKQNNARDAAIAKLGRW